MPIESQYTISLPPRHLATHIFGGPHAPLSKTFRALTDASRPETHYITQHSLRLWAKRFAAGLKANGLKTGDRVLVFSANQMFYSVVFLGVIMAGGIFTGANPTYVPRELAYQAENSGASLVLCQRGNALKTALEAASIAGLDKSRIFVFDDGLFESTDQPGESGCRYWSHLMASEAEGDRFAWEELDTPEKANRTLALNYSSGTTGMAKGVEITHANYCANTSQYEYIQCLDRAYTAQKPRHRWLCFLPLYHAMAQMIFIGTANLRMTPVFLMERFDFITMLKNVERFKISDLILVPPVVVALAKSPETKKYDLSSVWKVSSGAAPLSREVSEEVEALFPDGKVNVKQGWGMTECTCAGLGWDPTLKSASNAVGWPLPCTRAKIMSIPPEDDSTSARHELGLKEEGELWIQGPQVMKGYWRNAKATAETLTADGWLKTGDLSYYDEEHKFFISGRLKELIKVKGMQVAPAELDGACLECEGVADAAVVGVTINHEEHPRAYIVPQPGVPTTAHTAKRITDQVNAKVTRHKHITGGVVFVDALPKNPSGKILRRLLRERAQKEIKDEKAKL